MSSQSDPDKPVVQSDAEKPDLHKAQTFFQYGNDAALKSNFDYAIAMYGQASKIVTDNLVYRQALRGAERRKFNNDPGKVGMLVGAKNQPILMRAKSARSKGNHKQAIDLCEDAFVNNPWDVGAARVSAEAAEAMGLLSLAQWLVESVQAVTKDGDFLKFAAHIHEANESWQKAINCWELVKKFHPNDQDANRQINALSAAGTIKRAGLDDALDKRATTAPEPAESLDAKLERLKQEQLTPEQRLVKDILSDPKAVHAYLDLAEVYRNRGDLEKSEKVLAKGLKANANDPSLLAIYEDTQISRLKRAIDSQSQRVLQYPEDTGAKAKLDQLVEMRNKYEIEAYRRRTKLYPDDSKLHFELGVILARTGDHDAAIAAFQQARATTIPALKIQALLQAGLSFEANNANKLAERNYREALKLLEAEDKENFLALHYRLGRVCEALSNTEGAEEHYNEVAAIDYSYLDVAERLKRLI
jgi:tetratricopeptide (TPR) repeat protein